MKIRDLTSQSIDRYNRIDYTICENSQACSCQCIEPGARVSCPRDSNISACSDVSGRLIGCDFIFRW